MRTIIGSALLLITALLWADALRCEHLHTGGWDNIGKLFVGILVAFFGLCFFFDGLVNDKFKPRRRIVAGGLWLAGGVALGGIICYFTPSRFPWGSEANLLAAIPAVIFFVVGYYVCRSGFARTSVSKAPAQSADSGE